MNSLKRRSAWARTFTSSTLSSLMAKNLLLWKNSWRDTLVTRTTADPAKQPANLLKRFATERITSVQLAPWLRTQAGWCARSRGLKLFGLVLILACAVGIAM